MKISTAESRALQPLCKALGHGTACKNLKARFLLNHVTCKNGHCDAAPSSQQRVVLFIVDDEAFLWNLSRVGKSSSGFMTSTTPPCSHASWLSCTGIYSSCFVSNHWNHSIYKKSSESGILFFICGLQYLFCREVNLQVNEYLFLNKNAGEGLTDHNFLTVHQIWIR